MRIVRRLMLGALCIAIVSGWTSYATGAALVALSALGTGTESDNCPGAGETCTVTVQTGIKGGAIGTGTLSVTLQVEVAGATNGSGGTCHAASGTGTVTEKKATANLTVVGQLCDVGAGGGARTLSTGFSVTSGTGTFSTAAGVGALTVGINGSGASNGANATMNGTFEK
jgi:hypothetical protein